MASFRQRNNKWQARVSREGYPDQVKTFELKADAERWARATESEMDKGVFVDTQEARRTSLREIILRYVSEVTPTMKSVMEDTIRLKAIARKPIASCALTNLSAARIAAYRDERLNHITVWAFHQLRGGVKATPREFPVGPMFAAEVVAREKCPALKALSATRTLKNVCRSGQHYLSSNRTKKKPGSASPNA